MKAKITVVVPVYNVAEYLGKCLDSLVGQTCKEIKIICVNDGSTDNSGEVLKEYEKKDSRIEIINKKNGGLSSARNAGMRECKTDYIMFCDSDDSFEKSMCKDMLLAIEKDDSDLAVCENNIIYNNHDEMAESDEKYYGLNYSGKKIINDDVIINTNVSVGNKIFRMKLIQDNGIEFPEGINNEDFYFYNAYMSVARTITFVRKPLYNYIRRENSIMSNNFESKTLSVDHLRVAERLFDYYKKSGYIEKHTDLFWKQWIMSYWFSVEHSSNSLKKEVLRIAKPFVDKNLSKYPPKDQALAKDIKNTVDTRFLKKAGRKLRRISSTAYRKSSLSYRQQRYINATIEQLQKKYDELSERLNNLIKEQ